MIYLDTNIFVYSAINKNEKGKECIALLTNLIENNETSCTSVLTWDEIVYTIWKKEGKELALEEGRKFLNLPNIILIEATNKVIFKSQELIENYSLKPRDAIHAATAILNKCKEIYSDDPDFDKVKELKRISP
ncbi:type II toxin-antitoxin system VapC family toxin [Candidatus Pacearchaeota archaeon]|nr:type II toxin-antitoxin system VapC family toxin [Candidatus Pacearchaeota archaeon]